MMKNIVFLHGAFHGTWCWDQLKDIAVSKGYSCHALDCHEFKPDSVVDYIKHNNLADIKIVAHSLGGILVPSIFSALQDFITEVVFIAGIVLDKGESPIDYIPAERSDTYKELYQDNPESTVQVSFEQACNLFFNDVKESDAEKYYSMLTPQLIKSYFYTEANNLVGLSRISKYVICKKDNTLPYDLCASFANKLNLMPYLINAGHNCMLSRPDDLAQILFE
ncbi:MAG: alpha/beta hydrolase [Candidatus Thiodiazotropha sp.]